MRRRLLCLAAVVLVATAACGKSDNSEVKRNGTTTTTATLAAPKVNVIARIEANGASFVDIFGDRLTWTTGPAGELHDQVIVHDLRTGKSSVAASAKQGTAIEWSRGSGDTLVFTEQDYGGDPETTAPIPWRVFKLDLASGKRELVDEGKGAEFVPTVVIDSPWMAWLRPGAAAGRFDVVAQDLRSGQRSTVVTNVDATTPQIVDGRLVYAASSSPSTQDVFAVNLPSGKPRKLTTSGQVYRVGKSSGEVVAYEEPLNTDPQRVLVVPLKGGTPTVVHNRPNGGNIVTGDRFVAWFSQTRAIEVSGIGRQAPLSTASSKDSSVSIPIRISADGNRLAWGERPPGTDDLHTSWIVVAEVT
jgi:hypothetical protein